MDEDLLPSIAFWVGVGLLGYGIFGEIGAGVLLIAVGLYILGWNDEEA